MKLLQVMAAPILLGAALMCPAGALAQGTLTTLFTNGPSSNRINVVVLSEGYTASQLSKFLVDATNAVNNLLAVSPFSEYRKYFNGYAISVASAQSGSDHYTPSVVLVNTYFNSCYDSYGTQRLITIPPNDRDGTYANGQGKVNSLLQALMPEFDLVLLLVNDTQYGGSGGSVLIFPPRRSSGTRAAILSRGWRMSTRLHTRVTRRQRSPTQQRRPIARSSSGFPGLPKPLPSRRRPPRPGCQSWGYSRARSTKRPAGSGPSTTAA